MGDFIGKDLCGQAFQFKMERRGETVFQHLFTVYNSVKAPEEGIQQMI